MGLSTPTLLLLFVPPMLLLLLLLILLVPPPNDEKDDDEGFEKLNGGETTGLNRDEDMVSNLDEDW